MTRLPLGCCKALLTLLACLAIFLGPAHAAGSGLDYRLLADSPVVARQQGVWVTLQVRNAGPKPVSLLRWALPAASLSTPRFAVRLDGREVTYLGPLIKRAPPAAADYVELAAGATQRYRVDLAAAYDFSRDGDYSVEFEYDVPHEAALKGAIDQAKAGRSNPIGLQVEGRPPPSPPSPSGLKTVTGSSSFVGCSAQRQTDLLAARVAAADYATEAKTYFSELRNGVRYTTWFGTLDATRYALVISHFEAISTYLDSFSPLNFDCTCTQGFFAYVFPSDTTRTIYLCNAFWSAALTGTDSRAGTLIHEASHFTVHGGTNDFAYGQSAAQSLASSNPANAVMNADSHEYFAENTPVQENTTPSPPLSPSAQPGNGLAVISFTAPASTGGAPISNYQYSSNNGGLWTALSPADASSPVTIPGLANGTAYSFRLRAVNANGNGGASLAVSVTPAVAATVPGAPGAVVATAGNASASISFSTPASDGGSAITSYVVTSSPGGFTSTGCTASPCSLTGLSNGVAYSFTVRAVNAVGPGPASSTSNSVTPQAPQVILFGSVANRSLGDLPFAVSASGGGSGNPVTFASLTTPVCTTGGTNGSTITLRATGVCTLRASQAGSASFAAAADVEQSFAVAAATATVTLGSALNPANAGQSVALTATVTGVAPSGTVSFRDGANAVSGCVGVTLVGAGNTRSAECITSTLAAGARSLRADYSGDANNSAGSSNALSQVINALPTISTPSTLSLLEDSAAVTLTITVGDAETSPANLTVVATSSNTTLFPPTSLQLGGTGATRSLGLAPEADRSGSATITLRVTDAGGAQASTSFVVNVAAVNDAPSLTILGNRTHGPGSSGVQTVADFATASAGPNEEAQTVGFALVAVEDASAVVTHAAIAANGTLSYTLSGSSGVARFRATAVDQGGTANGGSDTSEPRDFLIVVGAGANVVVSVSRLQPNSPSLLVGMVKGATVASYAIDATNNGPDAVTGLRVDVPSPGGLNNVLWTCVLPGGVCTPASGTAIVAVQFNLAAGQTARTELSGEVNAGASFVEIIAVARLPEGVTALSAGRQRVVFIEPASASAVYKSGFE